MTCTLFKGAVALNIAVLIIHLVGIITTEWAEVDLLLPSLFSRWHTGLWQHCTCFPPETECSLCYTRSNDPAWFNAVKALEVIGLAAFFIVALITTGLLVYGVDRKWKLVVIVLIAVGGLCTGVGIIVFGSKIGDTNDLFRGHFTDAFDRETTVGFSFVTSVIAAGIALFVVTPLAILDLRMNHSAGLQKDRFYSAEPYMRTVPGELSVERQQEIWSSNSE